MMVVMCIMLGRNARNQLISEYKSITQTLQKQSNNAINDYFDELERCAYEISNDYLVNDFVSTPDPSGSKYYNLQPIQQSLSVYALQSGGEVSRYLYMDNIGRALSSDAIFRLHEFYASLGLEAAMSAGDWKIRSIDADERAPCGRNAKRNIGTSDEPRNHCGNDPVKLRC